MISVKRRVDGYWFLFCELPEVADEVETAGDIDYIQWAESEADLYEIPRYGVIPLDKGFDPEIDDHAQAYNYACSWLRSFATCCRAVSICRNSWHPRITDSERLRDAIACISEALSVEGWSAFDSVKPKWVEKRLDLQTILDERETPPELMRDLENNQKIYVIYWDAFKAYKIGIAIDPEKRRAGLTPTKLPIPNDSKVVHEIKTDNAVRLEQYLHGRFANKRTYGEWFNLSDDDVAMLCQRRVWLSRSIPA